MGYCKRVQVADSRRLGSMEPGVRGVRLAPSNWELANAMRNHQSVMRLWREGKASTQDLRSATDRLNKALGRT